MTVLQQLEALRRALVIVLPELHGAVIHGQQPQADAPVPEPPVCAFWLEAIRGIGRCGEVQTARVSPAPQRYQREYYQRWVGEIAIEIIGLEAVDLAFQLPMRLRHPEADRLLTDAGIPIDTGALEIKDMTSIVDKSTTVPAVRLTLTVQMVSTWTLEDYTIETVTLDNDINPDEEE